MQRDQSRVPHLGEILDTVVERSFRSRTRLDHHTHADGSQEGVEDIEQSLGLILRAVFVDGHEHVVVPEHRTDSKKGGKNVGNDIERVVQVYGKIVLMRPPSLRL